MTSNVERGQMAVVANERLADRYELHEVLGRGGMACVYRATDRSSGGQVALKQLVVPARAPTLGARYDRLVNEASRYGLQVDSALTDFEPETVVESSALAEDDVQTAVMRGMVGAIRVEDRAKAALQLICDMRSAGTGHLYLAAAGNSWVLGASRGEAPPRTWTSG